LKNESVNDHWEWRPRKCRVPLEEEIQATSLLVLVTMLLCCRHFLPVRQQQQELRNMTRTPLEHCHTIHHYWIVEVDASILTNLLPVAMA
jgi:hypothetical protein